MSTNLSAWQEGKAIDWLNENRGDMAGIIKHESLRLAAAQSIAEYYPGGLSAFVRDHPEPATKSDSISSQLVIPPADIARAKELADELSMDADMQIDFAQEPENLIVAEDYKQEAKQKLEAARLLTALLEEREEHDAKLRRYEFGEESSKDEEKLPDYVAIEKAHPMETGDYITYDRALNLVSERNAKYALVDMTNWLLAQIKRLEAERDSALEAAKAFSFDACASDQELADRSPHPRPAALRGDVPGRTENENHCQP